MDCSLTSCCQLRSGMMDEPYLAETKWQKQTKAAAVALVAIAILFGGLGVIGIGLGSTHSVIITGFSFVYHMAGMHFIMVGIGIFVASIIMALASTCRQEEDADAVQVNPDYSALRVTVSKAGDSIPRPATLGSARRGFRTWAPGKLTS